MITRTLLTGWLVLGVVAAQAAVSGDHLLLTNEANTVVSTNSALDWAAASPFGPLLSGFYNNGAVLNRSAVRIDSAALSGADFEVGVEGFSGHAY